MKSLLLALGLARTVVLGARIEAERIVVSVRPTARAAPLPRMRQGLRLHRWRTAGPPGAEGDGPDALGLLPGVRALQGALPGRRRANRPWARHGALHARLPEDWVAWLAVRCTASAVSSSPASSGTAWAACAGASTPSWRPRGASSSTACAASASTRRHYRRATSTSRWSSTTTAAASSGRTRGHRQGRAQPVPRRGSRASRGARQRW